jgi:hypothetical protein
MKRSSLRGGAAGNRISAFLSATGGASGDTRPANVAVGTGRASPPFTP